MATDAYSGAEGEVNAQKKAALDVLAQFGRRGLEAAVVAQQEGNRVQSDSASANAGYASKMGVGSTGQAEITALTSPGQNAYAANGQGSVDLVGSENDALGKVTGTYFDKVRQAVPLERTASAQIRDQYAAAYAERQAAVASAARRDQEMMVQAALQAQQQREQMARDAEFQRLVLSGMQPLEAEAVMGGLPSVAGAPRPPTLARDARVFIRRPGQAPIRGII